MFDSCRRSACPRLPVAALLLCAAVWPAPAAAQIIDDGALISSVTVGAPNDTYIEPALDRLAVPVEITVTFDADAFDAAFEGRTHYVLEYGYYDGTAVCGSDFEFWRPPGVRGSCVVSSHTRAFPVARRGVTLSVAGVLPDSVPEFPNEAFTVWVRVADRPSSRQEATVFIQSNPLPVHLMGLVSLQLLYPVGGEPVFEGESVWFQVILSRAVNVEVCVHVRAGRGTAEPGRDFVPMERRVCLSPYKVVSEVIEVRTLADDLPRLSRSMAILLEARYPGNPDVYHMGSIGVVILDATGDLGNLSPSNLWFGPAEHADRACASGAEIPLVLVEPERPAAPAEYVVDFAFKERVPGGLTCRDVGSSLPVTVRPDGDFLRGAPAHPGVDFEIAPRAGVVPHQLFVFTVVQDGVDEPQEHGSISVNAGKYGSFQVPVVVLDWRTAQQFVGSGEADYARMARLAGSILAGAVAQRFSCASSGRCGVSAADIRGFASAAGERVLRTLASTVAAGSALGLDPLAGSFGAAGPLSAPGGAPALGPIAARGAGGGFVPGFGGGGAVVGPGLDPGRLLSGLPSRALRSLSGSSGSPVSFQVRRGAVRNASRGPVWSAWLGGVGYSSDASAGDGFSVRSSVSGILGGLDRRAGPVTFGTAYGFLRGDVESRESAASVGRLQVSGSWHLVAPYFGYRPVERVRLWGMTGFSIRATSNPIDVVDSPADSRAFLLSFRPVAPVPGGFDTSGADRPPLVEPSIGSPAIRVNAFGVSATVVDAPWGVVDLEADELRSRATVPRGVGYDPRASFGASLLYTPTDLRDLPAWSGRPALRRRLGVRVGIPVGSASRIAWHTAARWDSGPDVDQLVADPAVSSVRAVDAGVELRLAPSRARVSLVVRYQLELSSSIADLVHGGSTSRHAFDAGLRFGAAESQSGWVLEVSPGYGYPARAPSLLLGDGLTGSSPASALSRLPSVPLLDLGVGYGFGDGSRLLLAAGRSFRGGQSSRGSSAPSAWPLMYDAGRPGTMRLGYERRW